MANRRMFAKTIIDSDAFIDMPTSTQALYFHLSMRADDDGFINNPKSIMRIVGAKDDDLKLLVTKRFIIPFASGVVVIKHWRIHNYIQSDRYTETKYLEEKSQLFVNEKEGYSMKEIGLFDQENNDVYTMDTQVRLGKVSLELSKSKESKDLKEIGKEKNNAKSKRFVKPTLEELVKYMEKYYIPKSKREPMANKFLAHYETVGWKVGKNKMMSWKSAIAGWLLRDGYIEKPEEVQEIEREAGIELWKSE